MKLLIENWRNYLKEIGEASLEPYDFESGFSDEDQVWYDFVSSDNPMDEGSDYLVKFTTGGPGSGDDAWDISFKARGAGRGAGGGGAGGEGGDAKVCFYGRRQSWRRRSRENFANQNVYALLKKEYASGNKNKRSRRKCYLF